MRRPKVKLDNLVAFLAVAEKRDINDAACEMGLSASAVRKHWMLSRTLLGFAFLKKSKAV